MTLNELLRMSTERFRDEKALTFPGTVLTYGELRAWVEALAGAFGRLGIGSDDAACLLLGNCPDFIASYFAIVRLGAAAVPLNTFLKPEELEVIIDDSQSKLIVTSSEFAPVVDAIRGSLGNIEHVLYVDRPDERYVTPERGRNTAVPPAETDFDDSHSATIIYTSGTTGRPKGVVLSHRNLTANVESCRQVLSMSSRDRFLLFLPMFHSFTLMVSILVPLSVGARVIICRSVKPFGRLLRRMLGERATIVAAVPAFYEAVCKANLPGVSMLIRSVRLCVSGSAPLSGDTMEQFERRFAIPLLEGYGLSEASPVVSVNPLDGVRKPGSAGPPVPGVEVMILDEEGSPVGTGQVGEIAVRGPNVMKGYLSMPEETAEVMSDGRLLTGDIGRLDADGYLYIVDRKKDLILHRGMNVYPREIEDVLHRHPRVKEAAVVGVPHPTHGEVPSAHVILKTGAAVTEQEIKDYCREHLADYKVPQSVRFTDDFPRTATGKVLKREIRKQCES